MAAGFPDGGRRLIFPHLGPVHPGIPAVELHQLFVGAFLGDPAIFYQQDEIRIPDGGKPVGDNKGSPPTGDCQHGPADPLLRHRIHGAGGLIQNQNRGLLQYGAGNGEKLAFPLAQGGAALGEYCICLLYTSRCV